MSVVVFCLCRSVWAYMLVSSVCSSESEVESSFSVAAAAAAAEAARSCRVVSDVGGESASDGGPLLCDSASTEE